MSQRKLAAAGLLALAAIPWLLTFDWRPMTVGILAAVTSAAVLTLPGLARYLLPALCGVSFVIFFISGLHREGIEIDGHRYGFMQLLTPFSLIALWLNRVKRTQSDARA